MYLRTLQSWLVGIFARPWLALFSDCLTWSRIWCRNTILALSFLWFSSFAPVSLQRPSISRFIAKGSQTKLLAPFDFRPQFSQRSLIFLRNWLALQDNTEPSRILFSGTNYLTCACAAAMRMFSDFSLVYLRFFSTIAFNRVAFWLSYYLLIITK